MIGVIILSLKLERVNGGDSFLLIENTSLLQGKKKLLRERLIARERKSDNLPTIFLVLEDRDLVWFCFWYLIVVFVNQVSD